jgi:hypothetical protein
MAYRSRHELSRRREVTRRQQRMARRRVRAAILLAVTPVAAVVAAIGAGTILGPDATGASSGGLAPRATTAPVQVDPPSALPLAHSGAVELMLPVPDAFLTVIAGTGGEPGSSDLKILGRQANEDIVSRHVSSLFSGDSAGDFEWVRVGDDAVRGLAVGAQAGTPVFAPVDGQITQIRPYELAGRRAGQLVEIQPQADAAQIVRLTGITDVKMAVGKPVSAGVTRLGVVAANAERLADAGVEQTLSSYTADAGDHVRIEVRQGSDLGV